MLWMFTESIFNAILGIFMPKWSRTIYEPLSAPLSPLELVIAYVGAAATKSRILGLVFFATAHLFVDVTVAHPLALIGFMALIAVSFALFGFIMGVWAKNLISEEHTSELHSLMRVSYAVFCFTKKKQVTRNS